MLVPSRALRELERLLAGTDEVTLRLGERDATFEIGSVQLTTRLIEGEFPNYRGLIPSSYPNVLTVGREALMRRGAPREADGPRGHARAGEHEQRRASSWWRSPRTSARPTSSSTASTRAPS